MQSKVEHGTFKTYTIGLLLCIALTLAAYYIVEKRLFSAALIVPSICALGLIQAVVQLILFLHLGEEPKPFWNLQVFSFMLLVLIILVAGSLWIMYHLDYRMMPPDEMEKMMIYKSAKDL